ncbi:MAG: protein-disulfide reductase DsbD family protein [Planctomycetota bacterium]
MPAGGLFEVQIQIEVQAPWHLYAHDFDGTGTPIALELQAASGLRLESVAYPPATEVRLEPITGETLRLLEGATVLRASLRVDSAHPRGSASAILLLATQACTDTRCLNPEDRELKLDYTVRDLQAGELLPQSAQPGDEPGLSLQDQAETALHRGDVGSFLWLCIVLAFVSLLTPCVFPMIPITVSFFSKRSETAGGRSVSYALAYGGGIVATYTGFGLVMAGLLGASSLQSFATNPWVNLAVGGLFVFFGLALMGFYELRPPAFLTRRAEAGASRAGGGYLSVVAMGFVFTITAFTCTAPIVGTLLAALTAGGSLILVAVGMFVYALAFALPFVLLAMFPGVMAKLPGAGGWMITLKVALGFLELVAALKFFSAADLVWDLEILTRSTMLTVSLLLMAGLALYLFGFLRLPHEGSTRRRLFSLRSASGVLAAVFALYLARGLAGQPLDSWTESFLPPSGYAAAGDSAEAELIAWREDLEAAKAEARSLGRPLFVDFTGVTCQNCRKVEKSIFIQPAFAEAVEQQAIPVRLYTDRRSDEHRENDRRNRELMEDWGSVTLPLYVLLSPEGLVLSKMGYSPDFEVQDFIRFLEVPGP